MKIGILGYGNLGRGVESAVRQNDDMELVCISLANCWQCFKKCMGERLVLH